MYLNGEGMDILLDNLQGWIERQLFRTLAFFMGVVEPDKLLLSENLQFPMQCKLLKNDVRLSSVVAGLLALCSTPDHA